MHPRLKSFVVPAAAGLLIVPAAALAGVRMLAPAEDEALPPAAAVEVASLDDASGESGVTPVGTPGVSQADLATACGPEAATLVAAEQAGQIAPLAEAALQALRPLCAEAGLPLPPAPTPEPVVVVETISGAPAPPPAAGSGASTTAVAAAPVQDASVVQRSDDDRDDDDRDDRDDDDRDDRDDDRDDDDREDRDDRSGRDDDD